MWYGKLEVTRLQFVHKYVRLQIVLLIGSSNAINILLSHSQCHDPLYRLSTNLGEGPTLNY